MAEILVNHGADAGVRNEDGRTILHEAASHRDPASVGALLHAGADPNVKDVWQRTPLHFAAMRNRHPKVISLLLDAGGNPNSRDIDGKTALDYARNNESIRPAEVFRRLESETDVARRQVGQQ